MYVSSVARKLVGLLFSSTCSLNNSIQLCEHSKFSGNKNSNILKASISYISNTV